MTYKFEFDDRETRTLLNAAAAWAGQAEQERGRFPARAVRASKLLEKLAESVKRQDTEQKDRERAERRHRKLAAKGLQ